MLKMTEDIKHKTYIEVEGTTKKLHAKQCEDENEQEEQEEQ